MKKLICLILLASNISMAACDWSTIKTMPNGSYEYSPTLNLCVGQLVQDSAVKDQQLADLNKALSLKDAALLTADQRIVLWQKDSSDQLDRLVKIESTQKSSEYLAFGLGVLATVATGIMTARLIGR
jgi:hypothetical protein